MRELRSLAGEKESHSFAAGGYSRRPRVVRHAGRAIHHTGWEQAPGYASRIGCHMTDARKSGHQVVLLKAAEGRSFGDCQRGGFGVCPFVTTMGLRRE